MNLKIDVRKTREFGILGVLILLGILIGIKSHAFLTLENLFDVILTNTVLGIMALGMLMVILTGGIDVSVAAILSTVTVIVGNFLVHVSGNLLLVFLVGAASGAVLGLINGVLIARLRIHPIVVTLGTMSIIYGVMFYVTGGNWVNSGIPQNFIDFGRTDIGHFQTAGGERTGIPIQFLFFVVAAALTWFLLRFTMFGRGIYAIGGNRISAERAGFNIQRVTILVYLFEGFLIGIAGVVHTSIVRQVDPNAFNGFELQVIAAVVLGGTSILGGYGSLFGTVLGVSLIAVLNNGLTLMRISSFWQRIIIGLVIIIAVSVDIIRKKRAEARQTRVDIDTGEEVGA